MTDRVYLFRILDEDAETDIYSCLANSETDAEANVRAQGFTDFYLVEVRDLDKREQPGYIDNSIKINPFVGKEWEPVIRAMVWAVEKGRWLIQTYGLHYSLSPNRSPYVQGQRSEDGSLHVELSGNIICDPPLDDMQIEQLVWVGWIPPGESPNNGPNFLRIFEAGWTPRMVAERVIETWTSIMNITAADYFSFSDRRRECDEIEKLGGLERSATHFGNPDGSIFRIISPANDGLNAKEFHLPIFLDLRGERWVEVFPRILSPLAEIEANDQAQKTHFDDLNQVFGADEIYQSHVLDERFVLERSQRQMREIWNAAFDESYRNDQVAQSDQIVAKPPRIELDEDSRSQTSQAHRIAYALFEYSRCKLGFLLLDRAENVVRLVNNLKDFVQIDKKDFKNLAAAAWLSMLTQPVALLSYNRRIEPKDLRSWGISDEVINILLALNPTNFEYQEDWLESLEDNPLARYLALAIELDRVILSEFPTEDIKTRLCNLGEQPGDFRPPLGVTQLLRIAHVIEGLATDEITEQWVDEVLANPRGFWEQPASYRWKSWDEFLFRTGSGQDHHDQFRFALAENPFWLPTIRELFASAESVRNIELFDSGALNLGLGIACREVVKFLGGVPVEVERGESASIARPEMTEIVKELDLLATRATEAADQFGFFFIDNDYMTSHQILSHLVHSGDYSLRVLAQKSSPDLWGNHRETIDTFERKDLIGHLDEGSLFALFVIATVFEVWKNIHRSEFEVHTSPSERLLHQLNKTIMLDPKHFGHRYFENGKRPCDVSALSYAYNFPSALARLGDARRQREEPASEDWDDVDFSPPAFDSLFGLFIFAITQRGRTQLADEKLQIDHLVPTANLLDALFLSVEGVAQSIVNDRRPCSILIGCTGPGRIEQTVEINASFKRGVLSLELQFCGEVIPVEGNESFISAMEEDPLALSHLVQTISVECREGIATVTRGVDYVFRDLRDFVDELSALIDKNNLGWNLRTVHTIVLRQEPGGFLETVLKYFGRDIERGVTRIGAKESPDNQDGDLQ